MNGEGNRTSVVATRYDRVCPPGWRRVKLGDVLRLRKEVVYPQDRPRGRATFVGLEHLESGTGKRLASVEVEMSELAGRKPSFRKGDIVYGYLRPYLNKVWIAEFDGLCSVDQYVYAVDLELTDASFMSWFMRSPVYLARAPINATPGQLPRIRTDEVASVELALPPLAEQRCLAAMLDEQMAAVDRARVAAEAQLEAAKELPAAYLRAAFDQLDLQRWPRVRLGDLLRLRRDVVHPHDQPKGSSVFVGLEHVESGTGKRTESVVVDMSTLAGRKPRFAKGDIVYGYLRPYLNKVWIAEFDGLCSVDQYVYVVDTGKADTAFIGWFMRSPVYLARAPIGSTPGQLPRIRTEEVAAVGFRLPSLAEQRRVASMLDERMAKTSGMRKRLEDQLAAIDRLPAAILREAFEERL